MFIQEGIRHMRHALIPIESFDKQGRHTHKCEFCDGEALCQDTFYLRSKDPKIGDTVLCRTCAKVDKMDVIFPDLPRLLEIGSNVTDEYGLYKYGLVLRGAE